MHARFRFPRESSGLLLGGRERRVRPMTSPPLSVDLARPPPVERTTAAGRRRTRATSRQTLPFTRKGSFERSRRGAGRLRPWRSARPAPAFGTIEASPSHSCDRWWRYEESDRPTSPSTTYACRSMRQLGQGSAASAAVGERARPVVAGRGLRRAVSGGSVQDPARGEAGHTRHRCSLGRRRCGEVDHLAGGVVPVDVPPPAFW